MAELTDIKKADDEWIKSHIENSAQAIFQALSDMKEYRSDHGKRWVYELLQNAIDATPDGRTVNVVIKTGTNTVKFLHDGNPFDYKQIAHLISHGTTKIENSSQIGRFGTGFLATHLISPKVRVKGKLDSGCSFEFNLDRSGSSTKEIETKMENTWREFGNCIKNNVSLDVPETEYTYEEIDEIGATTVKIGIDYLTKCIPYVMTFVNKLGSVTLDRGEDIIKWKKVKEIAFDQKHNVFLTDIYQIMNGVEKKFSIAVAKSNKISVAVILEYHDGKHFIEHNIGNPSIFVNFPLWDTSDIFPFALNCPEFYPTDDRSGIVLGEDDSKKTRKNKQIMEDASRLFLNLVKCGVEHKWRKIHCLMHIKIPLKRNWLKDQEWQRAILRGIVNKIEKMATLVTQKMERITPEKAYIPVLEVRKELLSGFWNLAAIFKQDAVPNEEIYLDWATISKEWAEIIGKQVAETSGALTIEKFSCDVAETQNLMELQNELKLDSHEKTIKWLNSLYKLICDLNKQDLFEKLSLFPNQKLIFQQKRNLYLDENIDEELKDIADVIESELNRTTFLHRDVTIDGAHKIFNKKVNSDILHHIISKIKEKAKSYQIDDHFAKGNTTLFRWLIQKNEWDHLTDNFPMLYRTREGEKRNVIFLSEEKCFLPPLEIWDADAKKYIDLFPSVYVLSSEYKLELSYWRVLQEKHLIHQDLFYKEEWELNDDELNEMLVDELSGDKEHNISAIEASNIVSLTEPRDKGILHTTRKSRERSRLFLRFLLDYVIANDNSWENPVDVDCICKSKHKVYSARWFFKIKHDKWVCVGKNRQEKPSSKNIYRLIKDDIELQQKLTQNICRKFLSRLDISVVDITKLLLTEDESEMQQVDTALTQMLIAVGNTEKLQKIANIVTTEPEFLQKFEEHRLMCEKVKKNQELGRDFERIVRDVFISEGIDAETFEANFRGYDIAVYERSECDIDSDVGRIEIAQKDKVPFLCIEVKTTNEDRVRMTRAQAQMAVEEKDDYALCVIQLRSEIINGGNENLDLLRNRTKIIENIGSLLQDRFNKQMDISKEDSEIYVDMRQARYVIRHVVWEKHGLDFERWIRILKEKLK